MANLLLTIVCPISVLLTWFILNLNNLASKDYNHTDKFSIYQPPEVAVCIDITHYQKMIESNKLDSFTKPTDTTWTRYFLEQFHVFKHIRPIKTMKKFIMEGHLCHIIDVQFLLGGR